MTRIVEKICPNCDVRFPAQVRPDYEQEYCSPGCASAGKRAKRPMDPEHVERSNLLGGWSRPRGVAA